MSGCSAHLRALRTEGPILPGGWGGTRMIAGLPAHYSKKSSTLPNGTPFPHRLGAVSAPPRDPAHLRPWELQPFSTSTELQKTWHSRCEQRRGGSRGGEGPRFPASQAAAPPRGMGWAHSPTRELGGLRPGTTALSLSVPL